MKPAKIIIFLIVTVITQSIHAGDPPETMSAAQYYIDAANAFHQGKYEQSLTALDACEDAMNGSNSDLLPYAEAVRKQIRKRTTPAKAQYTLSGNLSGVIGEIIYELMATENSAIIAEGKLEITPGDIIVEKRSETSYLKSIDLPEGFRFDFADFRKQKDHITGFGLTLDIPGKNTFSWDWYHAIEEGKARKIQGSGGIEFTEVIIDGYVTIDRMTFSCDNVLRCYQSGLLRMFKAMDIDNPDWTCTIKKGSYIHWAVPEQSER